MRKELASFLFAAAAFVTGCGQENGIALTSVSGGGDSLATTDCRKLAGGIGGAGVGGWDLCSVFVCMLVRPQVVRLKDQCPWIAGCLLSKPSPENDFTRPIH